MKNNRGQGLVEYALILVLMAVVVIVIVAILGPLVKNVVTSIKNPEPPRQPQASDYWREIIPPPGQNGKCYIYTVDNYHEYAMSVWCIDEDEL